MKKLNLFWLLAIVVSVFFSSCDPAEDAVTTVTISENVTTVTTWKASNVYLIESDISVDADLTIEPGTVIKFGASGVIHFGYSQNCKIIAKGTADKKIYFKSSSASPAAGAWAGLWFYANTLQNSELAYCVIENGGSNDTWGSVNIQDTKFKMDNCEITNSLKIGLYTNNGFVSFGNNTITNCGTYPMQLPANYIHTIGLGNTFAAATGYGILISAATITEPATIQWQKQTVPYIFENENSIETNLTIQAGTKLNFKAGSRMHFGYSNAVFFQAVGTATEPIIFSSSSVSPAQGAWNGLVFYSNTSPNTLMSFCQVSYAGHGGGDEANIYLYAPIHITNSTINHSAGWGIYNAGDPADYTTSNTFADNASGDVYGGAK